MSHWVKVLAKDQPWQTAYPIVAEAAEAALASIPEANAIGTAALVALLWPGQGPRDAAGKAALKRLYQALKAMSEHDLADYVKRGEPEASRWGKQIRRSYWFNGEKASLSNDDRIAIVQRDNPELYASHYAPKTKP